MKLKIKTKSAAKKRFFISAKGRVVKSKHVKVRHNLRRRSMQNKRPKRGMDVMHASNVRHVRRHLPYGGLKA